jgi:hypothetical protein
MTKRFVVLCIVALTLVGAFPGFILAQEAPPLPPHAFYGSVEVYGQPARVGAVIEVRGENVLIGIPGNPFTATVSGRYGGPTLSEQKLYVQGDLVEDQPLEFYVDGMKAEVAKPGEAWQANYTFISGKITNLNLRVGTGPLSFVSTSTPTEIPPSATPTPLTPSPTGQGGAVATSTATAQDVRPPTETVTLLPSPTAGPGATVGSATQPTPLPGAVVTKPTAAPAPAVELPPPTDPPPPTVTSTLAVPTEVALSSELPPTPMPTRMAARPNATVQLILAPATPPEAVSSAPSQTESGGSRSTLLWGGAGAVLLLAAVGMVVVLRRHSG